MRVTYHVVLSFDPGSSPSRLTPNEPKEVPSEAAARRMVERLRTMKAGVIAFSRTGDPETGDWDEAQVIASYGRIPNEVLAFS